MALETLLAIESTCDETAVALIDSSGRVLSECVATQESLHEKFAGVVPEIAARAHLERILPVIDTAMRQSGKAPEDLAAIAVATYPGLPGSLIVGLSAAKALALAWDKPIVGINHIQAHIYACGLDTPESIYPCVGFIVSGGHTSLYRCDDPLGWDYLGGTIDDAAGEAFDKVAVMLGLSFPGGPALSKLACKGDPQAIRFPRPLIDDPKRLDFSFSGLKTAVRYRIAGSSNPDPTAVVLEEQQRADIAAGFEQAVIDCLISKACAALNRTDLKRLCVGGGVAANTKFRQQLTEACRARRIELVIAKPQWCTDNAAMGALAWEKIRRGQYDTLELDVQPGLVRPKR
ncbi:MAG: tRNA (adenosine(37)-N6)-threonylcarbamoyltransferase complex transferase subunit TsaD [Pirellula sp.]|jgi:N6-L-threonylcarbamoyladenine synthase